MPRHELLLRTGDIDKFWTIQWKKESFTLTFGRVGTEGVSQTKRLATAEDVERICQKMLAEKLAQGYVETMREVLPEEKPQASKKASVAAVDDPLTPPRTRPKTVATPSTEVWCRVLSLLGVVDSRIEEFKNRKNPAEKLEFEFAAELISAPSGLMCDWKLEPAAVLDEVWDRLWPFEVKGYVEETDEQGRPTKIALQHQGVATRYRVAIRRDEPSAHDVLFALSSALPAELLVFSLLPFEETDGFGYLIQTRSVWMSVLEQLGSWFWAVFTTHTTTSTFKKLAGDAKPKINRVQRELKRYQQILNRDDYALSIDDARYQVQATLDKRVDDPRIQPIWLGGMSRANKKKKTAEWLATMETSARLIYVLSDLHRIGSHLLTAGAVRVATQDADGWPQMSLGLTYLYWQIRLSRSLLPGSDMFSLVGEAGLIIPAAYLFGEPAINQWMCEAILARPEQFRYWDDQPLIPFLLQLFAIRRSQQIDWTRYPKARFGIYDHLLRNWGDPQKLKPALVDCCDYHLMRTSEVTDQEFSDSPYAIFPAELLCIGQVRREMQLEMPVIEHELMQTPLANPPVVITRAQDELFDALQAVVERELPELWREMNVGRSIPVETSRPTKF